MKEGQPWDEGTQNLINDANYMRKRDEEKAKEIEDKMKGLIDEARRITEKEPNEVSASEFLAEVKRLIEEAIYKRTESPCPKCGVVNKYGEKLLMSGPTQTDVRITIMDNNITKMEYIEPEDAKYKYGRICESCSTAWTTEE